MAKNKNGRRGLRLTPSELVRLKAYAAKEGLTAAAVIDRWTKDFLEHGTDCEPTKTSVLNLKINTEMYEKAEHKARAEYDITLNDILHHEIARLR